MIAKKMNVEIKTSFLILSAVLASLQGGRDTVTVVTYLQILHLAVGAFFRS